MRREAVAGGGRFAREGFQRCGGAEAAPAVGLAAAFAAGWVAGLGVSVNGPFCPQAPSDRAPRPPRTTKPARVARCTTLCKAGRVDTLVPICCVLRPVFIVKFYRP